MNLETNINERLWNEIKSSYENKRFTESIKESIYYLSELIRNKTGLSGDGVSLVGNAFGGKNPKLKINKYQSESDISEQKGLLHALMGIYELIRNPRSHHRIKDDEPKADSIILFINYLISIIDKSKTQFSEVDFIDRVFDPSFVENEKYAKLLVKEIPIKRKLDIFIKVYREKESGNEYKLLYFFEALIDILNKDEKKQIFEIISDELKKTRSDKTVKYALIILPPNYWKEINETARLRIENKIIDSIKDGKHIEGEKFSGGWLATWTKRFLKHFDLADELEGTIISKLDSDDRVQQDYIFRYFTDFLNTMLKKPTSRLIVVINNGLKNGDKRFYDIFKYESDAIKKPFKEQLEGFKETPLEEDFTDEDIPF